MREVDGKRIWCGKAKHGMASPKNFFTVKINIVFNAVCGFKTDSKCPPSSYALPLQCSHFIHQQKEKVFFVVKFSSYLNQNSLFFIICLFLVLVLPDQVPGSVGFLSTNLPTKRFLVWFGFLKNPFSSYATVKSSTAGGGGDGDREQERRKIYNIGGKKDELKRVFATFDKNSDGFITKQELRDSLKNIGIVMVEKDIDDMVKNVDTNGDGLIDLDEFCNSFASLFIKEEEKEEEETETTGSDGEHQGGGSSDNITSTISSDGELKEAFDVFDGDKDGLITVEELGFVLSSLGFREGNSLEDCKEMIKKVDVDGDGMVSFHEFKIMMKSGHKTTLVPIF